VNVCVCIPWWQKGVSRDRVQMYVGDFWTGLNWKVNVSWTTPAGGSTRARNVAAQGDWDVAVFIDADKITRGFQQVWDAVAHAHDTGQYTVFHDTIRYMTEEGTRRFVEHHEPLRENMLDPDDIIHDSWEDGFAIRRDLWNRIGGYDERFQGYGAHGIAFLAAAGTVGGRHRIPGTLIHLWHPPAYRDPDQMEANRVLCDEYLSRLDNREEMLSYLDARA